MRVEVKEMLRVSVSVEWSERFERSGIAHATMYPA